MTTPEEEAEYAYVFRAFKIISQVKISLWEKFYHVYDDDNNREAALLCLNREKYLQHFSQWIDEHGEWDDEKEIPLLAEKKFEEIDRQFGERHLQLIQLPPHRTLPKVLDIHYDSPGRQHYAVTEYKPGSPFLLASQGLTLLQKLGLAKELLEGLDHMHDYKILHRRLKPGNIYVRFEAKKPVAAFTTWGLAVPVDKARGDRSGTPKYVPPEVLLQGDVTEQSDLWSWAAILYNALTGEAPHSVREEAQNMNELENIVRDEGLPNELRVYGCFQKLEPRTEEVWKVDRLQEMLFECLKPNPEERTFKNARSVLAFIEKHWPMVIKGAPESEESITISSAT